MKTDAFCLSISDDVPKLRGLWSLRPPKLVQTENIGISKLLCNNIETEENSFVNQLLISLNREQ
jgi:hypothetical protein